MRFLPHSTLTASGTLTACLAKLACCRARIQSLSPQQHFARRLPQIAGPGRGRTARVGHPRSPSCRIFGGARERRNAQSGERCSILSSPMTRRSAAPLIAPDTFSHQNSHQRFRLFGEFD